MSEVHSPGKKLFIFDLDGTLRRKPNASLRRSWPAALELNPPHATRRSRDEQL
jgi:hypothetical protein